MNSTNRPSSSSPDTPSPFDQLADLFLGEVDERSQAALSPAPPPVVQGSVAPDRWAGPRQSGREPVARPVELDVLIVSHLPVMAGPWVDQAAGALVEDGRPVMLLRERDRKMTVDLFPSRSPLEPADRRALESTVEGDAVSLRDVHQRLQRLDPRWLLRLPEDGSLTNLSDLPLPRLIILTGSDQAAVVATYRILKQIEPVLKPSTRLGLIVVGSTENDAQMAAERINDAAAEYLEQSVDLLAVIPRMGPVSVNRIGEFVPEGQPLEWTARSLLHGPLSEFNSERSVETGESRAPLPPLSPREVAVPEIRLGPNLRLTRDEEDEDQSTGAHNTEPEVETPVREEPELEALASTTPFEPANETANAEKADTPPSVIEEHWSGAAGILTGLVTNLAHIDVTCPKAPEVEIAVSPDGQLHLLALDSSEGSVASLLVARDWAAEHREILGQLCPFLKKGSDRDSILHLFTSKPKDRCDFISGSWRMHLLMPAPGHEKEATPGPGWLHVELN